MAKVDLFEAIDTLWTKRRMEGMPGTFIIHRFLASNQGLAIAAKDLQKTVKDEAMRVAVWMGILPKGRGAPRLRYVAPKKKSKEGELTTRMMTVLSESRENVEEIISFFQVIGSERELYDHYGIKFEE